MNTHDYIFKILLVGDSGTGKSSLMERYCDDSFSENFRVTIGVDFKFKEMRQDDKDIKLQIWDTAGHEKFRTITSSFYRGAHGVFLVFDISDYHTFRDLEHWYKEITKWSSEKTKIILVGNKSDLKSRAVDYEEAKNYADSHNMIYLETSAKSNFNVDYAFATLTKEVRNALSPRPTTSTIVRTPRDVTVIKKKPISFCNIL
eukprot:TRINITY_DN22308_c0_g1_i1.p1 TRINITY_DN22308_c0_g1~~TRINITY_DN22308_c0_g1_i1.p1  ORF type:complete len:202 (-),score=37.38 TRINITY_DN22308_c0_g1_i1:89-694(-)